ncbi:MAG: cellulase family glycosylhydrolase [Lachnospiraceae bacterium]|nr:cellulase family glycosylhydrolase [Lachnospiraceae bacterium]
MNKKQYIIPDKEFDKKYDKEYDKKCYKQPYEHKGGQRFGRFPARMFSFFLTLLLLLSFTPYMESSAADTPTAENVNTNLWGSGGQITFDLAGCSGYMTITVVVEFNSDINSPSGWGFDSYTGNGRQVTAIVRADGPNSWGINGSVGIQVAGSDLSSASVVSVSGEGSYTPPDYNNNQNNNQDNNQNNGGNNNQGGEQNNSSERPEFSSPAVSTYGTAGDDWLTTKGSKIVDLNGNEVWLTGCNWFGYNTGTNLFDGLWNAELESSIKGIADHGFNLLRVPMSAELLLNWKDGNYPQANYNHAYNGNLNSLNSLEIFDYVLTLCEQNGMKVMVDIHSANTDASGHNHPVWYTDKVSEDKYIESLKWLADRYKNYDTLIAYDLKNEPHGKASEQTHAIWNNSSDKNNWKRVAERAGNAILDINPHALIVIEGIQIYPTNPGKNDFTSTNDSDYYNTWWGGNLMAVRDYPIDFGDSARNRQIVYSPHDYGPLVYEQPWFKGGFTYDSLYKDAWYPYWLYIAEENIAPILIGEWGGFMQGDNLKWMGYLRDLIGKDNLHHTFWCYNANSGDTGGLVKDDFKTWDNDKYNLVKPVLWQNSSGQFISLDHAVALGANGVSLSGSPTPVINPGSEAASHNGNSSGNAGKNDEDSSGQSVTEKNDKDSSKQDDSGKNDSDEKNDADPSGKSSDNNEKDSDKTNTGEADNKEDSEGSADASNTEDSPENADVTNVEDSCAEVSKIEESGVNETGNNENSVPGEEAADTAGKSTTDSGNTDSIKTTTIIVISGIVLATLLTGFGVFMIIRNNLKDNKKQ